MFGFISRAQHDATIAAKDAEIARERENAKHWFQSWNAANQACAAHEYRLSDLEGKLARYTAPRERGEGGRFLPLKRVS